MNKKNEVFVKLLEWVILVLCMFCLPVAVMHLVDFFIGLSTLSQDAVNSNSIINEFSEACLYALFT